MGNTESSKTGADNHVKALKEDCKNTGITICPTRYAFGYHISEAEKIAPTLDRGRWE